MGVQVLSPPIGYSQDRGDLFGTNPKPNYPRKQVQFLKPVKYSLPRGFFGANEQTEL